MRQGNIHGETTYSYNQQGREIEALERVGEKILVTHRYTAIYDAEGKQIEARYSEGGRELKARLESRWRGRWCTRFWLYA